MILPTLREEISLLDAPALADGRPAWMLHDPARNRFFLIGTLELAILHHWGAGDADQVAQQASSELGKQVDKGDVLRVGNFLQRHQLVQGMGNTFRQHLMKTASTVDQGWLTFFANPLSIKIPLFHPHGWLSRHHHWFAWLFQPTFKTALLVLSLLTGWLILQQWDVFSNDLNRLLTPNGLFYFAVFLFISKLFHELGHALTAIHYGLHVSTMGVAIYFFWPMAYTEIPDLWRLTERRPRMAVAAAGMVAEGVLAILAACLWSFLPDGALRDGTLAATVGGLLLTLVVNLSPLVRFDGYHLLCNALAIPNLQEQATLYGRSWMRHTFFGSAMASMEGMTASSTLLLSYFFASWLYRTVISLSMAVAIYQWIFKALGLAFAVMILYNQLIKPVQREWQHWRLAGQWNLRVFVTLSVFLSFLALFFIPWQATVTIPAVHVAMDRFTLYPGMSGQIEENRMTNNQRVTEGEVLLRLTSPQLQQELQLSSLRLALLSLQMQQMANSAGKRDQLDILTQRLAEEQANHRGLLAQEKKLVLLAPRSGLLDHVTPGLTMGVWLNEHHSLARLLTSSQSTVIAFLPEEGLAKLPPNSNGVYYPEFPEWPAVAVTLESIAPTALQVLEFPELAAPFGGPLESDMDHDGHQRSKHSLYRVVLQPSLSAPLGQSSRGVVQIDGFATSLAQHAWRSLAAVVIRQSGF